MCAVIEIDVLKFEMAIVWTDMLVSLGRSEVNEKVVKHVCVDVLAGKM